MSHRRKYSTRKALFLLDYLQIVIMASSLEDVSQAFSRQAARLPDFLFQQRYPRGSNNSINAPNEEGSFLARLGFVSIIVYHAFLIVTRTRNLSHRDGAVKPGRFRFLDRRWRVLKLLMPSIRPVFWSSMSTHHSFNLSRDVTLNTTPNSILFSQRCDA
jgi:hypothetical protein